MNFYVVAFIFASQVKKETPHLSYCKVNVYIFRGSNSLIIFLPPFLVAVNSLRKELFLMEQILSFKSRLIFERL